MNGFAVRCCGCIRALPPERRSVTGLYLTIVAHGCFLPVLRKWTRKAGCKPALVRLRRRGDRTVGVRFCAVKSRAVSNRNCVAAMRGGEQRGENDQSVTQTVRADGCRELDSVGEVGRVCECKTKPVAAGKTRHSRDCPGRPADGWSRNGWKSLRNNQGDPAGPSGVHGLAARRTARRESERP